MSLKSRLPKINQVANADTTREIYRRDKYHFAYHVNSTRNGGQFQVIFNWSDGPTLTAKLWSFNPKENPHPANNGKTVCYQALGAIKRMVKEQGKTISFCETEQIAKKVKNFGGDIVKIVNPAGGTVWAVVKSLLFNFQKEALEWSQARNRTYRFGQTPIVLELNDEGEVVASLENKKRTFVDRVNLMRGPVEMGIE